MTATPTMAEVLVERALDNMVTGVGAPVVDLDRASSTCFELVRPLPFGLGVAPGTRVSLEHPDERYRPFLRLSLVDPVGPSFWAVEPWRVFGDYVVEIPEDDVELLGLQRADDAVLLVLVTLKPDVPTVNLLAPLVFNHSTRRVAQVILEESGFGCAVPIARTSDHASVATATATTQR